MKLYKHVSRFRVRTRVSKHAEKRIRWALSLNEGDLVNDCTMFNVPIQKIEPVIVPYNNGWFIYDVDFTVGPFGGGCSLRSCGVEPPHTREWVEGRLMNHLKDWFAGDEPGTASFWFGGRDKDDFKKAFNSYQKKLEAIQNGGHFTNERGELLPEFR